MSNDGNEDDKLAVLRRFPLAHVRFAPADPVDDTGRQPHNEHGNPVGTRHGTLTRSYPYVCSTYSIYPIFTCIFGNFFQRIYEVTLWWIRKE